MANFDLAYAPLLEDEGGYANNIKDKGKETWCGISRVFWPKWEGWAIIDSYKSKPNFPNNLKSDTKLPTLRKLFYQANFWIPVKGYQIRDQRIANSIFNFAVNADDNVSVKLAQRAVGVTDDGCIGNITLGAINAYNVELFLAKFTIEKCKFYLKIVEHDQSQLTFLYQWIHRSVTQ